MHNRIPEISFRSFNSIRRWFADLAENGLIFHPDDAPEDIVGIDSGQPFFSETECQTLNRIMDRLFQKYGEKVYEAAYPSFMAACGHR